MPYFMFKINTSREYHCLGQHADYRTARKQIRELRKSSQQEAGIIDYRLTFAQDVNEAEHLLRSKRERPPGEDA